MAFYKQDIVDINLNTGNIYRSFLNHAIGYKNDDADRFGIRTFRDGEPVDLTGVSCQAVFMAPDGSNIALTSYGTVSGNVAYVTLPPACYNYEGQFCLSIQLVGGGVTGTMRIVDGMVVNTGASGTVAPTSAVPTYQEIIAQYNAMVAATAAANGAIAATYSQKAYAVGEYCIHDGGLYRCTTAITTAEAWNAAHWTATKIGPDVSDLKSAIGYIPLDLTSYDSITGIIDVSTGKFAVNGVKNISAQYNRNSEWDKIQITASSSRGTRVSFLKSSASLLSNGDTPDYAGTYTTPVSIDTNKTEIIDIPSDCNYILFSVKVSNIGGYLPSEVIAICKSSLAGKVYSIKIDDTLSIEGAAADAQVTGKEFEYVENDLYHSVRGDKYNGWQQGNYNASTGAATSATTSIILSDIQNDIRFVLCATGYEAAFYGFNGSTYLGMWKNDTEFSTNVSTGTFKYSTMDIRKMLALATQINIRITKNPSGTVEVSDASNITLKTTVIINDNPCEYVGKEEPCVFDNILCIGDSLIEGGANAPIITPDPANAKRTVTRGMYSIPRFLEKMLGITATNWGISGATSKSWYNAKSVSEPDWGGHDAALIYIGSNDYTYATVGGMTAAEAATESETYINNIITKLRTDNPGIRIFLCTLNPNTTTGDLAQYRLPLMEKIRGIASSNSDVFLIDLNAYSSFKAGSAYSNGHPTAIGYQWMAREIMNYMSWWIVMNPNAFKWIRWIGTEYAVTGNITPDSGSDDGGYGGDVS